MTLLHGRVTSSAVPEFTAVGTALTPGRGNRNKTHRANCDWWQFVILTGDGLKFVLKSL